MEEGSPSTPSGKRKHKPYTCLSTQHRTGRSLLLPGFVVSWTQRTELHGPECPLHKIVRQTEATISTRLRVPVAIRRYLTRMAEFGLSYSSGKPTGFRLAPFLQTTNLVPRTTDPVRIALECWAKEINRHSSESQIIHQFARLEQRIVQLYRDGLSSPSDVDESGNTHIRDFLHTRLEGVITKSACFMKAVRRLLQMFRDYGVRVEPLDLIIIIIPQLRCIWHDPEWLLLELVDVLDNLEPEDFISMIGHVNMTRVMRKVSQLFDGLNLSPIVRAIFSRSTVQLDHQIATHPSSLLELTQGLTTLHFCPGWPEGLQNLSTLRPGNW
ncbi:hypothetical protein QBC35DRAFT_302323 [Podospora australis]|uniref:Uncharacterized protein n=1 Tax=Podospora australis TaxID=1536484 RepID=A0AAN6WS88_9PEZI|nr:hypothetical protein QBC35DRAFT_302323 [Podospora australis]